MKASPLRQRQLTLGPSRPPSREPTLTVLRCDDQDARTDGPLHRSQEGLRIQLEDLGHHCEPKARTRHGSRTSNRPITESPRHAVSTIAV